MKYMGSKNRIAKDILPLILKDRLENQYYIEPFVGGANLIDKVNGLKIGLDINKYLIAMFNGLKTNRELILDITKNIYDKARIEYYNNTNIEFDDFSIGWIGYMASANGRFFDGGYSGISISKDGKERNYVKETINNILIQKNKLLDIEFYCTSYDNFDYPENSIIYCDIPYQNTKQYTFSKNFNYEKFWEWARLMKSKGHKIFVSEYNAPDDFICIWEKEIKSTLSANGTSGGTKISVEKLFTLI